jgi:alkyl hydroperoxide reductase subunit F
MTYDLIIIGAGPAGSAAAVYAARKQLKTLMVAEEFGGQSVVSEKIYNWIGTPEIAGSQLAKDLRAHVAYYEGEFLTVKTGARVEGLSKADKVFSVRTNAGESFETRAVLITSGSGRRKLDSSIPGADALEHRGLTYCASCDGPLFSGQDVAVLGGGNAALETAAQLLAYCPSVTIIQRSAEFRADEITVEKVLANPKAKAVMNAEITAILGDKFVSGLKYKVGEVETELPVKGIFVEIGQIPNTGFAEGVVEMDKYKKIITDPRTQMTSVPGIWAAGDCADVLYHQNNIAAGDGVKALEDIYMYLHKNT